MFSRTCGRTYIQLGPVHPWDKREQHFFDGGRVEKPPDVVGDVPHVPRYLAAMYMFGVSRVYEKGTTHLISNCRRLRKRSSSRILNRGFHGSLRSSIVSFFLDLVRT